MWMHKWFGGAFPPRPTREVGIGPALPCPPVTVLSSPMNLPVVRPAGATSGTPAEKPKTTVYVGKIASTVENDFILSLLQLCGLVKSWKHAQDLTSEALKWFGSCEFDSAEGVLRDIRLLSKLNIDGQELMYNQATKEYLEGCIEKERQNSKNGQSSGTEGAEKEEGGASGAEKDGPTKPSSEVDTKEENRDMANKENHDIANFGLVTNEDKEADRVALEKLNDMIEERLKTKFLPPPPLSVATYGSGTSNAEVPVMSREGYSDVDIQKNVEDRNDDETTSESKPPRKLHKLPETSSPDRGRRNDRRNGDRERDIMKRGKERELERHVRERGTRPARRERDRECNTRDGV